MSPNAAYRHFASRQVLLGAVAERVQELMAERMALHPETLTGDAKQRARAQMHAVGMGYIEFALAEPGWFAVAFFPPRGTERTGPPSRATEPALAPPFRMLVDALDALVSTGALQPAAREGAEWPCWSTVHGFAEVAIHGPLSALPSDDIHRLAGRTVEAIITGICA